MELTAPSAKPDGMSAAPAAPDGSAEAAPEASNVAQVYGTKQKRMTTNLNFLDNAGTKTAQRRSERPSGDLSEASDTPRSPGLSVSPSLGFSVCQPLGLSVLYSP